MSFEVEKGCFARLVVPKIIPLEMSTLGTPLPPDFVYYTLRRSPG
jgi:hypothetical protein